MTVTTTTTTTTTITTTRTSEAGSLRLLVERRGERSALVRAEGHVPYAPRAAPGEAGWARVVLVQTIAGPLAGDRVSIDIEVGADAALELVDNAATVAYPCATAARHEVRVKLGAGARLAWLREPLILAAGCDLETSIELALEASAAALTREIVVLGRHGEQPGRYRAQVRCELERRPLMHETVEIDPEGGAHSSAALLGGARAFASLSLFGLVPEAACGSGELALAGPGRVARALGGGTVSLRAELWEIESVYRQTLERR